MLLISARQYSRSHGQAKRERDPLNLPPHLAPTALKRWPPSCQTKLKKLIRWGAAVHSIDRQTYQNAKICPATGVKNVKA